MVLFAREEAQKLHFSRACLRSRLLFSFFLLAGKKELIEERNSMEWDGLGVCFDEWDGRGEGGKERIKHAFAGPACFFSPFASSACFSG